MPKCSSQLHLPATSLNTFICAIWISFKNSITKQNWIRWQQVPTISWLESGCSVKWLVVRSSVGNLYRQYVASTVHRFQSVDDPAYSALKVYPNPVFDIVRCCRMLKRLCCVCIRWMALSLKCEFKNWMVSDMMQEPIYWELTWKYKHSSTCYNCQILLTDIKKDWITLINLFWYLNFNFWIFTLLKPSVSEV